MRKSVLMKIPVKIVKVADAFICRGAKDTTDNVFNYLYSTNNGANKIPCKITVEWFE